MLRHKEKRLLRFERDKTLSELDAEFVIGEDWQRIECETSFNPLLSECNMFVRCLAVHTVPLQ